MSEVLGGTCIRRSDKYECPRDIYVYHFNVGTPRPKLKKKTKQNKTNAHIGNLPSGNIFVTRYSKRYLKHVKQGQ